MLIIWQVWCVGGDLGILKTMMAYGAEEVFGNKGYLFTVGHASTFKNIYLWMEGLSSTDDRNLGDKIGEKLNLAKAVTPLDFITFE